MLKWKTVTMMTTNDNNGNESQITTTPPPTELNSKGKEIEVEKISEKNPFPVWIKHVYIHK